MRMHVLLAAGFAVALFSFGCGRPSLAKDHGQLTSRIKQAQIASRGRTAPMSGKDAQIALANGRADITRAKSGVGVGTAAANSGFFDMMGGDKGDEFGFGGDEDVRGDLPRLRLRQ